MNKDQKKVWQKLKTPYAGERINYVQMDFATKQEIEEQIEKIRLAMERAFVSRQ